MSAEDSEVDIPSRLRSALSGHPLDGSDGPTRIEITFQDGSRRNLTVSAAEAEHLSQQGTPASKWWRRAGGWVAARFWKLLGVVAGAYLASVLIPALVQQWSDRQKELELKNTLVVAISDLVADATVNMNILRTTSFTEDLALDDAKSELASIERAITRPDSEGGRKKTADEKTQIGDAMKTLQAATMDANSAFRNLFFTTRKDLRTEGASLESRLDTYFGDSELPERWAEYRRVVLDQFSLLTVGLIENEEERRPVESRILQYICPTLELGPTKLEKTCDAFDSGTGVPTGIDFPFVEAGDELLIRRVALLAKIRDANADGYSGTIGDFVWAILPG